MFARSSPILALVVMVLGLPVTPCDAATATFQEGVSGYAGTQDTELQENFPDDVQGTNNTIIVDIAGSIGDQQALLRFDNIFGSGAGQIPYGSLINSATLTWYVVGTVPSSAVITVHRMLVTWTENTTWNSITGGVNFDGTDASATIDVQVADPTASGSQVLSGANLTATVQAWSNGTANYGWAVKSDELADYEFRSSENGSSGTRPLLTVDYSPRSISGNVFEDVNYGGGAGRSKAGSSGVSRPSARVELFDVSGNFVSATTTDASGDYVFYGLANATFTVRVVNSTVTSSRTGYVAGLLPVQTYRTDASSGAAVAVTDHVGGEVPGKADAGNGSTTLAALTTGTTTAQSITTVVHSGTEVTGVDFGLNYDVIVRTGTGQGTLRQFLTNANALSNSGLAQSGRTAGIDNAIFMLADGTARAGMNVGYATQFTSGIATFSPTSALPTLTDPVILDGQTQPGWAANPILEIEGSGAGAAVTGLTVSTTGSTIRGFVINRFTGSGIQLAGTGNLVAGNWIGLNSGGTADQGNTVDGINVIANSNTIGGTTSADRNVVSGNDDEGIEVSAGVTGSVIRGNYVGLNAAGTAGVGNGQAVPASDGGIRDAGTGTAIGGSAAGQGNVIAGNTNLGVRLVGSAGLLYGNKIGTDAAGTSSVANVGPGVLVSAGSNHQVGGSTSGQGNTIAYNTGDGVVVTGAGTGNSILRNVVFSNSGIGIDLVDDGVTVNDGLKPAGQPNLAMDAAVFTSASLVAGTLTVVGHVGSAAGQALFASSRVEVFKSDLDASGYGEGSAYFGFLTADASGNFSGSFAVAGISVGDKISGTATDGSGNSSEFGAAYTVKAPGITVSPTSGLVTTEAGGTATFTIVLVTQPTVNVTIGLSSNDLTEGTVPASAVFTSANWSTPQTITVTGVNDAVDDGDIAYSIVTAAATSADTDYNGMNASDVTATNTDNDVAGITVAPTSGLVTTEVGGTATFTIVLDSQPTVDVTVGVSSNDLTEGTVAPASVVFTAGDWNVPQTVTVTGVNDAVDDGNFAYTLVTAAAVSGDPNYSGRNASDVTASNTDDDVAGITVSPTSGLVTTEVGGTATFTIVLDSQPTVDVTIGVSSNDLTEGTVSPASVVFTAGDWSVAQTITVTGVNDAVDDGDIAYSIVTAAAVSGDPNYSGRNASDVSASNTDDDVAGITVSPTSGLVTTEVGGTATFTIVLDSQPTADVTVGVSSNDLTEGTVSPASVTFTSGNWSTARTITVTGVNDAVDDGDIAYSVVTAAATSTDPNYSGRNASDVSATNTDDDVAGITVAPTSGLVTTEAGGTPTFTIVLDSQPTADVTVSVSSNDLTEGTVSPASVTFTSGTWSTPQTITVTGVNDAVDDGDIAYSIVTAAATSTDPNYSGRNASDVSATNTDDDVAGITVAPTSGLVTTEVGVTATFTIVLDSQPTADVTIALASNDLTEGSVAPASVTFTSGNWSAARTITVTGVNDAVDDGDIAYSIVTAAATSTDPNYSGRNPSNVSVTNTDDDVAGITVAPTSGLVTTEVGGTAPFTIVLDSQPIADVTIGIGSSDLTEGTVAPASVTFTAGDWSVPQTISVTGVNDDVDDGDIAYSIVNSAATSADPNYNTSEPADVSVTNTDDDVAGITVAPTSGLVTTEAGGTATFTIVLDSQPTVDVTVGISSSDLSEGTVAPAFVVFTAGDWNVPQTVTATGVDDAVDDGDIAYTVVTAAAVSGDPNYSGRNASDVAATNTDDDVAGITVAPLAGLVTTEAGGTATFTIVLDAQPTADVTIGVTSSDLTEGTVAPASVTFTAGDWNVAQTITVTGVNDAVDDGDIAYTLNTAAAASADPNFNGTDPADVAATNSDDDVAGITVAPLAGLVTTEAGGTATFTIVLDAQPTADVTIGVSSSDLTEGTVAPASLTFTFADWNVAQTITVTGVNDDVDDGDIAYTLVTAAATSADPNYDTRDPADVSATNTDDDVAGITVAPLAGLVTTEAGGTATFTIVLDAQPTADVTIGVSSSDLTEGTVAPASLTFTFADWNVAQTITVTGVNDAVDDGDIAYTLVTAAATSADPNYDTMNAADVFATNTDDDNAGITVAPLAGLVTTEAGGTATFTIVLDAQPTADVTIGVSSSDLTEGTVAPASLTFTFADWNVAQTITVTGVNDDVDDGDIAYTLATAAATSADPNYDTRDPADVSATNTDDDNAGITVAPLAGLVTTEAGGTATFTVVLDTQPTADVTIGVSSSDLTEGTVGPASVTFTAGDWNVAQTLTVTGVNDAVDDGDIAYTLINAASTSADPNFNGMDPADVAATNTDDDVAGITVAPLAGLVTTEAGGTATFTIVLDTQPTADVSIGVSSSDLSEGTLAPASVTFTAGDWNVAQTITVTGVNDDVDDGDISFTLINAAATSADPNFNGTDPADVSATNTDDDVAGITVAPLAGLVTTEAGGTATFTIVLDTQPTADVTIGVSSNDLTEGTVAPASLTFTASDWSVPQTVTATGVDDAVDDGDIAYTLVTAPATSADPNYDTRDPADVSATNTDDDVAGITVAPLAGLVTTEAGGTATFTIVLDTQPTADVTIGVSSSDVTEGTVAPASVTFTAADWNVAQTLTVTGVNDAVDDGDIAYTLITAAATSADPTYDTRDPADVSATNTDDDVAGITVAPLAGLVTTEAGGTATFTILLDTQPTADVTIGVTSSDLTESTVAPVSVTFTAGDWSVAQTVTVTGVNDAVDDGDIAYTVVTAAATSADPNYDTRDPADVPATNTDDDIAGITVAPLAGLVTTEAGGTATFTIVLDTQPTADVTIGVSSNDLTEGTVAPASVTFTAGDWNVAQTLTVTGVNDAVDDGDIAYTLINAAATSADPNFNVMDPADVSATNTDDDVAGITVAPLAGLVTTEAGGTATFTIVLDAQPTADVTIGVSSSDPTEGTVAPASLTFTAADWNVAQIVTVTGVDDAVDDGDIAYTLVTAAATSADPNFNGMDPADVAATNTDDDVAGITVVPLVGLVTTEGGGTATFTVVLDTQPTADVTIGVSSSDLTEGTVALTSVTFTAGDWNVAQTLTVTGVNDDVDDGDIAYTLVTAAATSSDPNFNGMDPADVSATNTNDDVAGITVAPLAGLVTTEGGGTATFTIVLDTQPTADVTIGVSSSDLTEGTVAPASLTFTAVDWSVAQTVTVTGVDDAVDDGDIAYTLVTAAATSADPNFNGMDPADVAATNTDDDVAGITVAPLAGLVTTEAGGTATFTVVLDAQPAADVTVGLSSSDLTEGTIAPASLTFTAADWSVAQIVTVTGVNDAVDDGDVAYTLLTATAVSADPNFNGMDPADVAATNTDDDVAGITVAPLAGLVTTEAGGTAAFTIVLDTQPTADVTIGASSSDLTEGTVAPGSLIFTAADWNVAQTVTVTGVNDAIDDGDIAFTLITATAVSADPNFNGMDPADVAATNTDDDAAGITVAPLAGLVTTEAGGIATFTIVLDAQPTADVTIGVASNDLTEGTVSPASVIFTAGDWNVPQTLMVTGVNDAVDDGDIAYGIVTAVAASGDPNYAGRNAADVAATNLDDDAAGITVAPIAGLVTTEAGGTASFTIVLGSQPTADVTIGVSSSDLTEGTVAPASLTFSPGNWNVAQMVTLTGVDDAVDDGDIVYAAITAAATSADPNYQGSDPADVAVTNADDDVAAVRVVPTAGLVTTEAGGAATFTIVLDTQPTVAVTIGLSTSNAAEGVVLPASVAFTTANWSVAQTVTVTGVDDSRNDGDVAYTVVTAPVASADPAYSGVDPTDVAVTNVDDDVPAIVVTPTAGLITTEAGGTASFTVVLGTQPAANVTIGLASSNPAEGTVAPASLVFTAADWNVPHTATVTGVDDIARDGDVAYTVITAPAIGGDPDYSGFDPADVGVTNLNDDGPTDSLLSTVTVNPPVVDADGVAASTITVTLRETSGRPAVARTVVLSTDRGANDVLQQPASPTGASGVVTGTIRSSVSGVSFITASVVEDTVVIAARPQVTFTRGTVVRLEKAAGKNRVVVGQPVGYEVRLTNQSAVQVSPIRLEDRLPAHFRYVPGTTRVNGAPAADPSGDLVLTFDLGALDGYFDVDGNGVPSPADLGFVIVSYQLVVGAGATPGDYVNTAIAKDACATCVVSNAGEAHVTVEEDPLLARGTIVGRVFEDSDRDGRFTAGESGLGAAVVVLDDGSYATTDNQGLYHFPSVIAGQRLVKIDTRGFGMPVVPTTQVARVMTVSPGLMVRANFGVSIQRDTVEVGQPALRGLAVVSETPEGNVEVIGNVVRPALLLNSRAIRLRTCDARITTEGPEEVLRSGARGLEKPAKFLMEASSRDEVERWVFRVIDAAGDTVRTMRGLGAPPPSVAWDGTLDMGASVMGGKIYRYSMEVTYRDGLHSTSPMRMIGVDRDSPIALTLAGNAFNAAGDALTPAGAKAMKRVAEMIRRSEEKIVIEVRAGSSLVAPKEAEMARRQARTAGMELISKYGIASDRLVFKTFSGDRNLGAWRPGDARVVIRGHELELDRAALVDTMHGQARVRLNDQDIPVDVKGRFSASIATDADGAIRVQLIDRQNRAVETRVVLPRLDIQEPRGIVKVPYADSLEGIHVAPRAAREPVDIALLAENPPRRREAAVCRLVGSTDAGNTLEVDGDAVAVDDSGRFEAQLPLRVGANTFGVLVRNPAGYERVANLRVLVADRDENGEEVVAVPPIPPLVAYLPPKGMALTNGKLSVSGRTRPDCRVVANGDTLMLAPDGSFSGTIEMQDGSNVLQLRAIDPDGRVALLERPIEVQSRRMFLVALADGVVGRLDHGGALDPRDPGNRSGLHSEGRLAYYLKGHVAGRYLLTSAFDTGTRDIKQLFQGLDETDRNRLLINLDPDRVYPIYGDSSTVTYDAQSASRFYLALDGDDLKATVGNFPLNLGNTELASFQRTLFGARAAYKSLSRTPQGAPNTEVVVLGAQARHAHARDEIRATGGSLYYLSRSAIIEGSEQIALVIRDQRTGLPLRRLPQRQNVDYVVKYAEGRVLFTNPIPSVSNDDGLIELTPRGGHPVWIEADYEHDVGTLEKSVAGGRVRQQLGVLGLGATYVEDASGAATYRLHGVDGEVRLSERSKLALEVAESRGAATGVRASDDGGLSFQDASPAAGRDGRAFKAGLDLDLGEWKPSLKGVRATSYWKRVESGFFSSGNLQDRGFEKLGMGADADLGKWGHLGTRYSRESRIDSVAGPGVPSATDRLGVQWRRDSKGWGLAGEVQTASADSVAGGIARSTLGGGALWWSPRKRLRTRLERQQTLAGAANDLTTLGLEYRPWSSIGLEARASDGSTGRSLQGGASFTVGKGKLYVREGLHDRMEGRSVSTIFGAQTPIGPESRAYTEYQWLRAGDDPAAVQSVLGLERAWRTPGGLRFLLTGERGETRTNGVQGERGAIAGGASYAGKLPVTASTRAEFRNETGASHLRQYLTTSRVETKSWGGVSMLAHLRLGETRDLARGDVPARFAEHGIGVAFRPANDRVNALARYTRLTDRRLPSSLDSSWTQSSMGVLVCEGTVSLTPYAEWSTKGALRILEEGSRGLPEVRTHTGLYVNRLSLAVRRPVSLGVEYRVLSQREARDRQQGWLNEMSFDAAEHMRFGLGYNFTNFSDDELSRERRSQRGWFVRAQGRY